MKTPQTSSAPDTPLPRKRGRPSRNDQRHDLQARLLEAALEAFADGGFDGASLSQIAKKAETDIALIRYYFGSKQDLWTAALDDLNERLQSELSTVLKKDKGDSATQTLKTAIHWFVEMSAAHPALSRIIVHEGNDNGERGKYIAKDFIGPFYDIVADLIEGAKREESVPDVATRTVFFMITHGGSFPMAMPALTNAFPGGKISSKRALRAHYEAIVALVMRENGST